MMEFTEQIKQFAKRVESLKETIQTEEATKTSIIMPFFTLLGYDVFNPNEFTPEFTADVGIKKGEKVDYAIILDGKPSILIEAKCIKDTLTNHDSQLFRYFVTSKAKFAILTNGIIYRFFTDLEEQNKMDEKPFLEINILDIKENQIVELKKFHKTSFDVETIFNTASELKYSNEFKNILSMQLQNPTEEFVRFFLTNVYSGQKTQNVIEKFKPILKKSLNQYINEMMNDKIKNALNVEAEKDIKAEKDEELSNEPISKIFTSQDELECYFIIKNILRSIVPIDDITYKDTESYFGVLYKNNVRKWICRIQLNGCPKALFVPDDNKPSGIKYTFNNIYEIENYKDILLNTIKKYL